MIRFFSFIISLFLVVPAFAQSSNVVFHCTGDDAVNVIVFDNGRSMTYRVTRYNKILANATMSKKQVTIVKDFSPRYNNIGARLYDKEWRYEIYHEFDSRGIYNTAFVNIFEYGDMVNDVICRSMHKNLLHTVTGTRVSKD